MFVFENLPNDVLLEIIKKTTRQDQARLSQVNKFFKHILTKPSLELSKHKSSHTWYKISDDVCLMIRKLDYGSYVLTLFNCEENPLKQLFLCGDDTTNKIAIALESGYPKLIEALISALNPIGGECSNFAKILFEESQKIENDMKLDSIEQNRRNT